MSEVKPIATVCLRGEGYAHGHMLDVQLQLMPDTDLPVGTRLYDERAVAELRYRLETANAYGRQCDEDIRRLQARVAELEQQLSMRGGEITDTPPAGDGARVTDAERHDMERKARELLAVEYERRGSRRMAEGIRSTPAAEFGDRDLGCAVRAIVAALSARDGGDGARVTDEDARAVQRLVDRIDLDFVPGTYGDLGAAIEAAEPALRRIAALAAREGGVK